MSTTERDRVGARVGQAFQTLIPALILDNERIARAVGLSLVDNQVLHALTLSDGPLDHTDLGRVTGQPRSTVSRVIDRLEDAGFVRRAAHPTDRRRLVVEAVPERVAELESHYAPFIEAMTAAAEGFTDDELAVVARYLESLSLRA